MGVIWIKHYFDMQGGVMETITMLATDPRLSVVLAPMVGSIFIVLVLLEVLDQQMSN